MKGLYWFYWFCVAGFLLGLALLVSLTSGFTQRCRRLICASYHPEREQVHTYSHMIGRRLSPCDGGDGLRGHRARGENVWVGGNLDAGFCCVFV